MGHDSQDRLHDGNGRFVRSPETAARDREAADLRSQGLTLQQIADHLGYSNKANVHHAIKRALKAIVEEPAERLRVLELQRLDAMYEAAMGVLERKHFALSGGKVVYLGDDEPLEDDAPVLAAIDRLLKIQARRAALLGLDAATKTEVSGGVRYELVGIDPEQLK